MHELLAPDTKFHEAFYIKPQCQMTIMHWHLPNFF